MQGTRALSAGFDVLALAVRSVDAKMPLFGAPKIILFEMLLNDQLDLGGSFFGYPLATLDFFHLVQIYKL